MSYAPTLYLLDTNIASDIIRSPVADDKLLQIPMEHLSISAITEAELLYGLAIKPSAKKLSTSVYAFLERVEVLPWNSEAARSYAELRASSESEGVTIDSLDLLIAAHAMAEKRTLVTRDRSLLRLKPWLRIDNWLS